MGRGVDGTSSNAGGGGALAARGVLARRATALVVSLCAACRWGLRTRSRGSVVGMLPTHRR